MAFGSKVKSSKIVPAIFFILGLGTVAAGETGERQGSEAHARPLSFSPLTCRFPGTVEQTFDLPENFQSPPSPSTETLECELVWTGPAASVSGLVFLRTADGLWYQTHRSVMLDERNAHGSLTCDLSGLSSDWVPMGHALPWSAAVRSRIKEIGLRFWSRHSGEGRIFVSRARILTADSFASPSALRIADARVFAETLAPGELQVISFHMNDDESGDYWEAEGSFTGPDGKIRRVPDFSFQDFRPQRTERGWILSPVGPPLRKIRFRPTLPGPWTWRVELRPRAEISFVVKDPEAFAAEKTSASGPPCVSFGGAFSCTVDGPNGADCPAEESQAWLRRLNVSPLFPGVVFSRLAEESELPAVLFDENGGRRRDFVSARAIRLPVEWDVRWHGFGGLGRTHQELAWLYDRLLEAGWGEFEGRESVTPPNAIAPTWILLDGAEFGGRGIFNWFSNPLSTFAGGPLKTPGLLYRTPQAITAVTRRLRYQLGRFGHAPTLGTALLSVDLNAPGAAGFHAVLLKTVEPWLAAGNRRLASLHPELDPARTTDTICGFEEERPLRQRAGLGWKVFRDVSPKTKAGRVAQNAAIAADAVLVASWSPASRAAMDASEGQRAAWLSADYPGEASVRWTLDENWYEAEALVLDVKPPADAPHDVRMQIVLRDGEDLWYERLCPELLRPGDWNRLTVPLRQAGEWRGVSHERPFGWWTRTRLKEVGLRFHSRAVWKGALLLDRVALARRETEKADRGSGQSSAGGSSAATNEALLPLVLKVAPKNVGRVYEWSEWVLDVPAGAANPFDPEDLDLTAEIVSPQGDKIVRPAFFYMPYRLETANERERLLPLGAPDFRMRFAPLVAGRHSVRFVLRRKGAVVATVEAPSFEVASARRRGFVRVSASDPRWFETSEGGFFFVIGHNLRSPIDERNKENWDFVLPQGRELALTSDILTKMGAAGENYARMWMSSWWLGLEWDRRQAGYQGTGRYHTANAWRLDRVLDAAEAAGVRLELVLNYHGQWNETVYDSEWLFNPYNAIEYDDEKVGGGNRLVGAGQQWPRPDGFLNQPSLVFTDERCQKYLRQRFRYIISRWGASTSVFSWALWNEVNAIDGYERRLESWNDPTRRVAKWHQETVHWFKKNDPYARPVTTQFNTGFGDPAIWRLPEISYTQMASYNWGEGCLNTMFAEIRGEYWDTGRPWYAKGASGIIGYDKPALCDEFGGNVFGGKQDMLEEELHVGLWGSTMMGLSGTAQFWWWNFVHEKNLYGYFRALADFLRDEDFRGKRDKPVRPVVFGGSEKLECWARVESRWAIGWVVHPAVTATKFVRPRKFLPAAQNVPSVIGASVRLESLALGEYEVEFWDTLHGRPLSKITVRTKNDGSLPVPLPEVKKDVAFKVKPKNNDERDP